MPEHAEGWTSEVKVTAFPIRVKMQPEHAKLLLEAGNSNKVFFCLAEGPELVALE